MTWRYVAARETIGDEQRWTVREYYSDVGDMGPAWSAEPDYPLGEDRDELVDNLRNMLHDVSDGTWFDLDTKTLHEPEQ